jgi:hypothetical protein
MQRHRILVCSLFAALFVLSLAPTPREVEAQSSPFTVYDLIGAVNALRADYGLPDFNIVGSLMASAQAHSEYQASIETITHYGPGGITANERAAAAGYGGRVSENIAVFTLGNQDVMSWIIYEAWADDLHMNTMINPQYLDVGAGVAIGGGRVYITLDAGWPSGTYPLPTRQTWTPEGNITPGISTLIAFEPILVSTPMPDGSLYHIVGFGQSLIGIAGAYGMSVTDLATLNNINPDQIYDGQTLLIRQAVTPSATPQPTATLTPEPAKFVELPSSTAVTPEANGVPTIRLTGMIIIGVCVLAALILLIGKRS